MNRVWKEILENDPFEAADQKSLSIRPLLKIKIDGRSVAGVERGAGQNWQFLRGERCQVHHIDDQTCIRCGICVQVSNFNAIVVES